MPHTSICRELKHYRFNNKTLKMRGKSHKVRDCKLKVRECLACKGIMSLAPWTRWPKFKIKWLKNLVHHKALLFCIKNLEV
jgi:hypothetical protein